MNGQVRVRSTPLAGAYVLERTRRGDERGWLERLYDAGDLAAVLGGRPIFQVNRTLTRSKGTVRGLHYQVPPSAEAKIVTCLRGAVFDVAIDLRHGSPTFLGWHAEILDGEDGRSLVIPEGCAHGVQALADDSELLYVHTAAYDPTAERGVHPLEPLVGIGWPLPIAHLSARDAAHPPLDPGFAGILL